MATSISASTVDPNVFDAGALTALKRKVKEGDPKALKAAAQQFEALFLQMVLKSMRDATPREGFFDNEQTKMYESLLDQQMVQVLAAKGGGTGLAAMIEKQLARQNPQPQAFGGPLPLQPPTRFLPFHQGGLMPLPPAARDPAQALVGDAGVPSAAAREFTARLWPAAEGAARATGIPAHFMVAQAALETGWGRAEPRRADGSPSFNVFGVKAGKNWKGAVVEATTTEYVDGAAQKQVERFRAYGSYAEAFRDYSGMLATNPRYAEVLGVLDAASFARGLQRAGYATDPMYAAKLERIIGGTTLRQVLAG